MSVPRPQHSGTPIGTPTSHSTLDDDGCQGGIMRRGKWESSVSVVPDPDSERVNRRAGETRSKDGRKTPSSASSFRFSGRE
ncbi:C2 domain-containing protein 2-like protein [Anopheles sinensis]|uniref:C2 domain-containing protein 2-like protein n=1 Tax=Anopheles sinensis TaxID=74873 RepID=A0A084WE68_ANOSI|nr:C2 domain-containing protein 2-like protein [Anopheles sinensis]